MAPAGRVLRRPGVHPARPRAREVRPRSGPSALYSPGPDFRLLVSPQFALASGAAFLFSELADFAVYTPLRRGIGSGRSSPPTRSGFIVDSVALPRSRVRFPRFPPRPGGGQGVDDPAWLSCCYGPGGAGASPSRWEPSTMGEDTEKRILVVTSCTGEKSVKTDEALTLEDFRQGQGPHREARSRALRAHDPGPGSLHWPAARPLDARHQRVPVCDRQTTLTSTSGSSPPATVWSPATESSPHTRSPSRA